MIQWIQEPTDTNTLRDFQQWKEKCDVKVTLFSKFAHHFSIVTGPAGDDNLVNPCQQLVMAKMSVSMVI